MKKYSDYSQWGERHNLYLDNIKKHTITPTKSKSELTNQIIQYYTKVTSEIEASKIDKKNIVLSLNENNNLLYLHFNFNEIFRPIKENIELLYEKKIIAEFEKIHLQNLQKFIIEARQSIA